MTAMINVMPAATAAPKAASPQGSSTDPADAAQFAGALHDALGGQADTAKGAASGRAADGTGSTDPADGAEAAAAQYVAELLAPVLSAAGAATATEALAATDAAGAIGEVPAAGAAGVSEASGASVGVLPGAGLAEVGATASGTTASSAGATSGQANPAAGPGAAAPGAIAPTDPAASFASAVGEAASATASSAKALGNPATASTGDQAAATPQSAASAPSVAGPAGPAAAAVSAVESDPRTATAADTHAASADKHPATTDGQPPQQVPVSTVPDASSRPVAPAAPAAAAPTAAYVAAHAQPELGDALARLRSSVDGTHQLTVQLHPAELGAVNVTAVLHNGTLNVTLAVSDPAARAAVTAALPQLQQQLSQAGYAGFDLNLGGSAGQHSAAHDSGGGQQSPAGHRRQGAHDEPVVAHEPVRRTSRDSNVDRWL